MRGIGPRALGSSQVSDWFNNSGQYVVLPSRPSDLPRITVIDSQSKWVASTTTTTDPLTAAEDDTLLVIGTCPLAERALTPSSSGLTFTAIYDAGLIGPQAWYAPVTSGQGGSRTVTLTNTNSTVMSLHAFVLRGVHLTTPVDVSASRDTYSAASSVDLTGVTTQTDYAMAVVAANTSDDNSLTMAGNGWVTPYGPWNIATNAAAGVAFKTMIKADATGTVPLVETANGPDAVVGAIRFALRAA